MKQIVQKLCIILAMLGLSTTMYAYDFAVDGIYYYKRSDGKSVSVTYGNKKYTDTVTIPSQVTYGTTTYSVTSIGNYAFKDCSGLTSVTIPNSVTSIGSSAFYNTPFYNSKPDGVVYLGRVLYKYKSEMPVNTSILIDEGTVSISPYAFDECSGLTSVTIPNSVTEIGDNAFFGCDALTYITIPNSVTYIGSSAFQYCSGLTSVTYNPINCTVSSSWLSLCNNITSFEIGDGVESIPDNLCRYLPGLTSVTIPNSVTSIGSSAFSNCSGLTSVTYNPINCTVSSSWLSGCNNITSFEIGDGVESIQAYLCNGLSGLTSVTIPNSVTSIGEYAFFDCDALTYITIPNSVTSIGSSAFSSCNGLTSVTIGNSVTEIMNSAFYGCGLAKVIWLPNTPPSGCSNVAAKVHYVANDQYSFNNQIKYQFLSSIFTVDGTVYVPVSPSERTCDAIDCTYVPECKSIVIDGKVSNKGIEMSVVDIKPYTYYKNYNIEDIAISIKGGIGDYAFGECFNMAAATLGDEVTLIGNGAFYNCSTLTGIVIPNSVKSLGTSAFENCSALETATIGTGVPALPQRVFYGCKSLASLLIPNNVASIGDKAFAGCKSISDFTIEDGENVLTLGSNGSSPLFVDCPLDEVYIGRKLSYSTASGSGYSPFYRNASLRTVEITDAETQIYDNEFYGCSSLQSLKIGDGVTTIGKWAFSGCSALEYFLVGSNVESIGQEAFSDCTSLTSFTSNAAVPPTCGSQALDDINKWECTLYVPAESIEQYKVADQWKDFFFIEESGIEDITVDADLSDEPVEYFNLQGIRIENPTPGVYIVKRGRSVSKCVIR